MGAWFLCTAIGNYVAGAVAAVASSGGSGGLGLERYSAICWQVAIAGFVFGAACLLFAPLVNRLMHGVR